MAQNTPNNIKLCIFPRGQFSDGDHGRYEPVLVWSSKTSVTFNSGNSVFLEEMSNTTSQTLYGTFFCFHNLVQIQSDVILKKNSFLDFFPNILELFSKYDFLKQQSEKIYD